MEEPEELKDRAENYWQDRMLFADASLSHMYKYGISTDVTLQANNDKGLSMCFSAHKLVLACRSPIFADMFYNKSINSSTIVFDNMEPRALDILLWYVYNDSLEDASICELIEAFKVAKCCEIYSFCDICAEKFLEFSENINASTVCSVLHIANFTKCKTLRRRCIQLIINDPENALSTEDFFSLDKETVWIILQELKPDACQKIVLKSVIRWMQRNSEFDRKFLSVIDMSDFSTEDFLSVVEEFPNFFTGNEVSRILSKFINLESSEPPEWCKFSEKKSTSHAFSFYEGMELIKQKSQHVKTDCNRKFHKASFFGLHDFHHEILLRVSVFNNTSRPVMLELAFGSEYVPLDNLTIDLRCSMNSCEKLQSVKYIIIPSPHHYNLLFPLDLIQRAGRTFKILLSVRARNLDTWGVDGPISSHQYRVACVSNSHVSDCIDTISTDAFPTVQITPFEDWLLFLDPVTGDKNFIVTSFFFDTIENIERYMKYLKM